MVGTVTVKRQDEISLSGIVIPSVTLSASISNNERSLSGHVTVMVSISPNGTCAYFSNKSEFTEFWFDMYYFTNDPLPADKDIMTT